MKYLGFLACLFLAIALAIIPTVQGQTRQAVQSQQESLQQDGVTTVADDKKNGLESDNDISHVGNEETNGVIHSAEDRQLRHTGQMPVTGRKLWYSSKSYKYKKRKKSSKSRLFGVGKDVKKRSKKKSKKHDSKKKKKKDSKKSKKKSAKCYWKSRGSKKSKKDSYVRVCDKKKSYSRSSDKKKSDSKKKSYSRSKDAKKSKKDKSKKKKKSSKKSKKRKCYWKSRGSKKSKKDSYVRVCNSGSSSSSHYRRNAKPLPKPLVRRDHLTDTGPDDRIESSSSSGLGRRILRRHIVE